MIREQFDQSAARLRAVYTGISDGYLMEVFSVYKHIEPNVWNTAVDNMIKSRDGKFKPSIPEYGRWVILARSETGEEMDKPICTKCNGHLFVRNDFIHYDQVIDAVSPCPECNSTAEPKRSKGFIHKHRHDVRVSDPAPLAPEPKDADFVLQFWDTDEPLPDDPKAAVKKFSQLWLAGRAKVKTDTPIGKILAGLKPDVSE